MNLWLRLAWLLIAACFKPKLPIDKPGNTLQLRVWPNDLDLNMHMNNGRYLTVCDLSRVDLFIRSGLAKAMYKNGWMPVLSEHTMNYKRSLSLFQKYELTMQVVDFDDKAFHMTHTFIVNERVVAEGHSKGVVLSKQGPVPPAQVVDAVLAVRPDLPASGA